MVSKVDLVCSSACELWCSGICCAVRAQRQSVWLFCLKLDVVVQAVQNEHSSDGVKCFWTRCFLFLFQLKWIFKKDSGKKSENAESQGVAFCREQTLTCQHWLFSRSCRKVSAGFRKKKHGWEMLQFHFWIWQQRSCFWDINLSKKAATRWASQKCKKFCSLKKNILIRQKNEWKWKLWCRRCRCTRKDQRFRSGLGSKTKPPSLCTTGVKMLGSDSLPPADCFLWNSEPWWVCGLSISLQTCSRTFSRLWADGQFCDKLGSSGSLGSASICSGRFLSSRCCGLEALLSWRIFFSF